MKARRLAVLLIPVLVVALVGLVSASGRTPPSAAAAKPARPPAVSRPVLVQGSRGAPVRRVQTLLNRHGFQVPVTGFYGPRTARQVRRFQAAHGIPGTGKVGPLTWSKLLGSGTGPARVVYLTFDDGPTPAWTPRVLELLARYRAQATFFVLGRSAAAYPELVRQEFAAGHGVGNHTWSHRRLTGLTGERLAAEVGRTSAAIQRATGTPVRCLRPPYATVDTASASRVRALGLRLVLWDIDTNDWLRPGAGVIADRVLGRVRPGDVVLLHDGGGDRAQTVAALERVLATLSARGFRFSALCRS
ncbi:MAG TPA: polysaccharide deacetylase family protein [Actinomycetota bacterium]|jgi:peptidoglycan/xylan/chitin deacetylase (PgdA/CDA1 family)|nr:polysaccharide deacetylase family protein [Actinomycetota bacterium]